MAQIKSASLLEQQAALTQLLINNKCKIWSLHKHRSLVSIVGSVKEPKMNSMLTLTKQGKTFFDPKYYSSLNVDRETPRQHKSSNLLDKNYSIPLGKIEGLHLNLLFWKKLRKLFFLMTTFLKSYLHIEMPLHLV